MNGFFKSRLFVVLLTLIILLSGIPAILLAMGQRSLVRDTVMALTAPLMRGTRFLGESVRGFADYFTEFDRLKAENAALSARVAELTEKVYDASLLESENAWMRTYLGAKRAHMDYTFCDAHLIGSEVGGLLTAFTLDRGTSSGIAVGMPVLTEDGVVGRVTEVGLTYCRVSTLINYDSSIGAYVERSGAVGLCDGSFERRKAGECILEYLDFDADIEVGDRVLSSGLGSVYPRGLVLGEVTEVTGDAYRHAKIAVVRPTADLSAISNVMILTGYTVSTDN